jgi:hypothetical protein
VTDTTSDARIEAQRSDQFVSFFRHGELLLVLERTGEAGDAHHHPYPELDEWDLQEMRSALLAVAPHLQGHDPLHPTPFRGKRGPRTIIPLDWIEGSARALQVVNLRSWDAGISWLDRHDDELVPVLRGSVADVGRMVERLNDALDRGRTVHVGPYRLLAVSPNWVATPFQGDW